MSKPPTKTSAISQSQHGSEAYATTDRQIVELAVGYRALPKAVIEHAVFKGKSCGNALANLSKSNDNKRPALLKLHKNSLPGGLSYVQPTAAACRMYGVSEKRSEPLGPAALSSHLGIGVFCELGDSPRRRVSRAELTSFLGDKAPRDNVYHVLSNGSAENDYFTIYRVYQAVPEIPRCMKHLTRLSAELSAAPKISEMVRSREYGIAVLALRPSELATLKNAIVDAELEQEIAIICDLGPTAESLHEVLKSKRA